MRSFLIAACTIVLGFAFVGNALSAAFASRWEGGHTDRDLWQLFLRAAPLIYVAYCLICALMRLSGVPLLISGVAVHLLLLLFCYGIWERNLGLASQDYGPIVFTSFFTLLWIGYCWSARRQQIPSTGESSTEQNPQL